MRNLLLLFAFLLSLSLNAQITFPGPYNLTVDFDANQCSPDRAALELLINQLDSVYTIHGSHTAILEVDSYSWELQAGVPLCSCRQAAINGILLSWKQSKGLPTGIMWLQRCLHLPHTSLLEYSDFQKVTIMLDAFL